MLPLSASATAFRRDLRATRSIRGFTLIELLTVIAIIAILASITLSVVTGVNQRAAISRTKAELVTLAQALESYKRQYGDYPQTEKADELLQSLIGKRGPRGAEIRGKILIEMTKFATNNALDPFKSRSAVLIDAWDRTYEYVYKPGSSATSWTNPDFVLYSRGPKDNGKVSVDGRGLVTAKDGKFGTYIFANKL
jgi:prepilin-type N-terminal cleavage/methylation domain-containing protein